MRTPLTRVRQGGYRHACLGVEVQKTPMADFPWELVGVNPGGSGVVLARTLQDARAFLSEIEEHLQLRADALLEIHRYLFPERYEDVAIYEWHPGTLDDVAQMLGRALAGDPRARLTPK